MDPETAATTVPGCTQRVRSPAACTGRTASAVTRSGTSSCSERAGDAAAEFARSAGATRVIDDAQVAAEEADLLAPLGGDGNGVAPSENPYQLHEDLQLAMQDDAGIGRSEELLRRALAAILALRERSTHIRVSGGRALNPGWHTCRDVTNMLVLSEAIVRGAIERRESRGSQWRFDHLDQEVEFGKVNFVTRRGDDGMQVVSVPFDAVAGPPSPASRAQPFLRSGQACPRDT